LQGRVRRLEKEIKRREAKLVEYSSSNKAYEKQIDACLKEELEYRLEIKGLQAREKQYRQVLGLKEGESL
jgi:polyribonucleotide nucleotidyltransferase